MPARATIARPRHADPGRALERRCRPHEALTAPPEGERAPENSGARIEVSVRIGESAVAPKRDGSRNRHCEGAVIRAFAAKASFMTWNTAVLSTKAPFQP